MAARAAENIRSQPERYTGASVARVAMVLCLIGLLSNVAVCMGFRS
jgi:hypothetical protein